MAKKQSLSYSPNMGLIAGEAAVAGSEAARTSLGGQAFTQNLSASVIGMIDEEKKRKAEMQGWMTDLISVDNINKLDQNYNKQAVTDFVRSGRDEFAKLAAIYKKTGNLDVMDKMNDIKYSFQNLNNQLENLQQDRKTYIDQFNKGKIVTIKGDEKYTDIYTNKGQFKIEKNGDIGFSHGENGSVYSKFNDIAGKWNPDNSIYGKEFLTTDSQEVARAQKGDQFDARGVRNRLGGLLNQQSWQEVQVAFMQDIIGDDEMELEDGRTAGNMSFQALWSTGQLNKKFYEGFKAESDGTYNTDWMFEKENRSLGTKLKAMYDTDVIKSRHEDMFKAKPSGTDSDGDDAIDQLNPFGNTDNERIEDGSAKGRYLTYGTRNERRKIFINIHQGKKGAGDTYNGALANYTWDGSNWKIKKVLVPIDGYEEGDTIDPTVLMQNEKIFSPNTTFEQNLFVEEKEKTFMEPIEVSSFDLTTVENVKPFYEKIQTAFKNKNEMAKGVDLRIERGSTSIKIFDTDGNKKVFKFNPYNAGTAAFIQSENGKKELQRLLTYVNSLLNVELPG